MEIYIKCILCKRAEMIYYSTFAGSIILYIHSGVYFLLAVLITIYVICHRFLKKKVIFYFSLPENNDFFHPNKSTVLKPQAQHYNNSNAIVILAII